LFPKKEIKADDKRLGVAREFYVSPEYDVHVAITPGACAETHASL
jgi:hypothetical protein